MHTLPQLPEAEEQLLREVAPTGELVAARGLCTNAKDLENDPKSADQWGPNAEFR